VHSSVWRTCQRGKHVEFGQQRSVRRVTAPSCRPKLFVNAYAYRQAAKPPR
jgi:hypothetical protein